MSAFLESLKKEGWQQLPNDLLGYVLLVKGTNFSITTRHLDKFVMEPIDIEKDVIPINLIEKEKIGEDDSLMGE